MACGPWPLPQQRCLCPLAEWRSCPPSASEVEPSSGADARARAASRGSRCAPVPVRVCGSGRAGRLNGRPGPAGSGSTSDCRRRASLRSRLSLGGLGRSQSCESASAKPEAQRGGQSHRGNRRKTKYWAKFLCTKKILGQNLVVLCLSGLPFGLATVFIPLP